MPSAIASNRLPIVGTEDFPLALSTSPFTSTGGQLLGGRQWWTGNFMRGILHRRLDRTSLPNAAMVWRATCSTLLQLAQPESNTSTTNVLFAPYKYPNFGYDKAKKVTLCHHRFD